MRVWKGLPWVTLVLLAGSLLVWREKTFRNELMAPAHAQASVVRPALIEKGEQPFAATTVALAFGLSTPAVTAPSAENMTLKASFVSSLGHSRALLADSTSERIYRVGDRLPSGSVLRRIDDQSVVLWRGGREEILPLAPPGERLFRLIRADDTQPVAPRPSIFIPSQQPETEYR